MTTMTTEALRMIETFKESALRRWSTSSLGLPLLGVLALGLFAAEARAEIEVHLVNCTRVGLDARAFDAKDSAMTVPASEKKFDEDAPGQAHLLRCHGQGKGLCKLRIKGRGDSAVRAEQCPSSAQEGWSLGEFKLEKDHHLFIVGFQLDPDVSGYCRPSLIENASATACDSPAILGNDFPPP